jgi:hypothetical protein
LQQWKETSKNLCVSTSTCAHEEKQTNAKMNFIFIFLMITLTRDIWTIPLDAHKVKLQQIFYF